MFILIFILAIVFQLARAAFAAWLMVMSVPTIIADPMNWWAWVVALLAIALVTAPSGIDSK